MRKVLPIILIALFCFMVPVAITEPALSIELQPEPIFGQVWAYETYLVNMSVQDVNLSSIDFSSYSGDPVGLSIDGNIQWKGKGGYDFGESTTGYNLNLDETSITEIIPLGTDSAFFNLTIEKDAYDYGRLPFETITIIFKFDVYVIMSDDSLGPKIVSKSRTFVLIDEMKTSYLEGKYLNMKEEINLGVEAFGLESFNRVRYLGILEDMNNSLAISNYVDAHDVWDDYDEDDRFDLIMGLIRASNIQYSEIENLQSVEEQLQETEDRFTIAEIEYRQLENTYNALSNTYHKVNTDLEIAKRNLSTAITAVFLTAIVFYFLGRRDIRREEAKRIDEPDIY